MYRASQVTSVVKNLPGNAEDITAEGSIPRWERSPGEGHGNPLQYSCLGNLMESGGLQAIVSQRVGSYRSSLVHTHTHTQTHIYAYTMEYYSSIRKKVILSFAIIWMDPENIMLSKISQAEKDKNFTVSLKCGI